MKSHLGRTGWISLDRQTRFSKDQKNRENCLNQVKQPDRIRLKNPRRQAKLCQFARKVEAPESQSRAALSLLGANHHAELHTEAAESFLQDGTFVLDKD